MGYMGSRKPSETSALLTDNEGGFDNLLSIVEKAGDTDILTDEEFAEYSSYLDAHYSTKDPNDHFANLADHLDTERTWLNRLALDVIEWFDNDLQGRTDWEAKESRGIKLLGISPKTVGGGSFKGASKVTHPLLIEACVQFQARALAEMWPSSGPVKTVVMGESTDEGVQQSERVEGYMNYQYMTEMPGAFEEEDRLLFRLPISGSCFKKTVYDPLEGMVVSRFIESSTFVVPYAATSLATAVRYTEKFEETANDTAKKIAAGVYRDISLYEPRTGTTENTLVEDEIDLVDGWQFVEYEGDHPYTRYECYCYLEVPGFEDVDEKGNETGVALPYLVTVDFDNQEVLAIRRNWKRGDIKKKRKVFYTHYKFLPGLGFYGIGLVHAIGGLAESATGALRALLDAAGFANTKGGYKSRDAKIEGGDDPIGMGEWRDVDASPEELQSAFFALPYDEPSKVLFELLGTLDELGRRFASTTENMIGEANNTGPVGTTLALIEQGSKVFSAIHLRLHHSHAEEFKLLASLDAEYLPEEYPYNVPGESRIIKAADFDDRVDVIPVSDPNIISNTQRIATAQGVLELASGSPDLYDIKQAHKDMLEAMRVPNIDELMPEQDEMPPADPVTESAMMIRGEGVKAFMEQDHEAHIAVHEAIFSTLSLEMQERIAPAHAAHQAEHKAFDVILHFESLIGGQITPEEMDTVTAEAAQVAQMYVGEAGVPSEGLEDTEGRKNAETMGNIKRKDLESAAGVKRADDAAAADNERKALQQIQTDLDEADTVREVIEDIPGG